MLGYPDAALADAEAALNDAREIGHAVTLLNALVFASLVHINCGNYSTASRLLDELVALADEKGGAAWKAAGMTVQGFVLAVSSKGLDAVQAIASGWAAYRSTGTTWLTPTYLLHLALAYAEIGQFGDAGRCIDEAITVAERTKEKWWEAEIDRMAGEIALRSPEHDAAKAQACFERGLDIARSQQARSWQLRAATSLARLWRDQGKPLEARDLLAPVYAWFTEGFDTLDLIEAKALLDELAS